MQSLPVGSQVFPKDHKEISQVYPMFCGRACRANYIYLLLRALVARQLCSRFVLYVTCLYKKKTL